MEGVIRAGHTCKGVGRFAQQMKERKKNKNKQQARG